MAIPQSFIQELLSRVDVVDVVGRYVQLKKGGANFMGLCPFHGEKSPSFSVSPTKQFFHCFGCGKNGNAITFLIEHAGMSFVEAINDLSQQYGLLVPNEDRNPDSVVRAAEQKQKKATLNEVLNKACDGYKYELKRSERAKNYLKSRGLSGEVAKQFSLGYAPEGWRSLASIFPEYDNPLLVESGLVIHQVPDNNSEEKRYDRFRDRVIFPIRNVKGECIGFGGRVLNDEKPKYINSPETNVFSKGQELYGLFEARSAIRVHGFALITEGYMDVVALSQLGYPNTVATLGTACTTEHIQKLFRFTDSIVFSFDGDAAGQKAAQKALEVTLAFATDTRTAKFLFLPSEHDPDSFIRAHGTGTFGRLINDATPLSKFLLHIASQGCDLNTAEGRARTASHAKPMWLSLPHGTLKLQILEEIGQMIHLTARELTKLWSTDQIKTIPFGSRNYDIIKEQKKYNLGKKFTQHVSRTTALPTTRADHVASILLRDMTESTTLSNEDQHMLCSLPEPHGLLFAWLESQMLEYGAQPWVVLREGLRKHILENFALEVISNNPLNPLIDKESSSVELRGLLNRMLVEDLKLQETKFIEAAKNDPNALLRYKEVLSKRIFLEKTGATESS